MDINAARAAIEAILASIDDEDLPTFERVDTDRDGRVTAWWGGRGSVLGSAKRDGQREPLTYRSRGSWDAIEGEMTYRADRRFLENGDKLDGLDLKERAA